jgi:hypothetical protein
MHLGSYDAARRHYDAFRDLTSEEVEQHRAFTRCLTEARERLSLFRMLNRNYSDWRNYLNRLLSADFREDVDVSEELNRLLLNYLTFAYSIQKHFDVSFRQRFKKQPAALRKYSDFIDRLCDACWPFAFVLDYRGYVQHVGLGISFNSRTANDTSVRIKVTANAKALLAESRQWERSRLTTEKGELDLIAILKEFHVQMLQSYAAFVVKTFFPELVPAAEFYARLTTEIQERHPTARMIFYQKKPEFISEEGGKKSLNMNFLMVPNDVFADLGIKVEPA